MIVVCLALFSIVYDCLGLFKYVVCCLDKN